MLGKYFIIFKLNLKTNRVSIKNNISAILPNGV
jgi:hypothetical protein